MTLASRLFVLALALLPLSRPTRALIIGFDPEELTRAPGLRGLRLIGKVVGITWQGHGRALPPRVISPAVPLDELHLRPPPGTWTDLVLQLDGPLALEGETEGGAPVHVELDLDELVVPLDDPDARGPLSLHLELPGWLAGAANGGLDVEPGHPLHDALAAALADGTLAVPAPR